MNKFESAKVYLGEISDKEISLKFNVCTSTVVRWRKKLGIKPTKKQYKLSESISDRLKRNEFFINLLGKVDDYTIATQFNVSHTLVFLIRKELGLKPYKKIKKFDFIKVLDEIRKELVEYDENHPNSYEEINEGLCADFATAVWEHFGKSYQINILSDEDMNPDLNYTHTFIEFEDEYFDSECIDGVDNWTQLPIFHRSLK